MLYRIIRAITEYRTAKAEALVEILFIRDYEDDIMKVGDCPKCYSGTMERVNTVKHFDGVYKVYRCNKCRHVCEKKL